MHRTPLARRSAPLSAAVALGSASLGALLLACSSAPSTQPVAIPPPLFADPAPQAAGQPPVANTATTPTTSSPGAAAPALGPTASGVSSAHVPVAAGLDVDIRKWRERSGAWEAVVVDGGDRFTWRVLAEPKHPLALVTLEAGGRTIQPMKGAILADGGSVASVPPRVADIEVRGAALAVTYRSGLTVELTPLGRALRMDVDAGSELVRTTGQLDFSQGGVEVGPVGARGGPDARILCVPFFDIAAVAALPPAGGDQHFLTTWLDPARSNATLILAHEPGAKAPGGEQHYGQLARYRPSTAGQRKPLRERVWISFTDQLADALPSMDRPPAEGRAFAARHFYLSLNAPDFAEAEAALQAIAAQGVGTPELGVQVWMHQWQKDGYDTGYPSDVFPPNPAWGGLAGLRAVREAAGAAGYLFALHHNWMFNSERLADESLLDADGGAVTSDQGGHYLKPRAALRLVDEVEGEFHAELDTRGTFSDSLSASLPRADADARTADWGSLAGALDTLGAVVERLRAIHGSPTGGEGSLGFGHVIWSGPFDVVPGSIFWQAEPNALARSGRFADVVPHFAWGRLHATSVRAGVGPPLRFMHPAGTESPGYAARDRDLQQTMALVLGGAGFHWWYRLSVPGDVARDWWSSADVRAALANPEREAPEIAYFQGGRRRSLEEYVAGGGSLAVGAVRLRLRWANGDVLHANLTGEPWRIAGERIAPFGYLLELEDADLVAGLVVTPDGVLEFVEGPDVRYVDARGVRGGRGGLTTDGAVGARRDGDAWRVWPLTEYTLDLPALDAPERVEETRFTLETELVGDGQVTVEWFDARGLALTTETVSTSAGDLTLTRARFEELGASSVRVRGL